MVVVPLERGPLGLAVLDQLVGVGAALARADQQRALLVALRARRGRRRLRRRRGRRAGLAVVVGAVVPAVQVHGELARRRSEGRG